MAFDNDAGVTANNAEQPAARDSWVKPEILSFEAVSGAQATTVSGAVDGGSNTS